MEAITILDMAATLFAVFRSCIRCPSTFSNRAISLVSDTGIRIAKCFPSLFDELNSFVDTLVDIINAYMKCGGCYFFGEQFSL